MLKASSGLIIFVYLSYTTACRLTFALPIQYLFCSISVMHYDEVKYQQRFEYIALIFRQSYAFSTKE